MRYAHFLKNDALRAILVCWFQQISVYLQALFGCPIVVLPVPAFLEGRVFVVGFAVPFVLSAYVVSKKAHRNESPLC